MPDGDRIHGRLTQAYEKSYEQICEGHFGPEAIAYDLLAAISFDLKRYGLEPIHLLFQIAEQLDILSQDGLPQDSIDWREQSREIERRAQLQGGNKRGMELAIEVSRKRLRGFQNAHDLEDHLPALVHAYLVRVYMDSFEGRLPRSNHHAGIDANTFMERLHAVRQFVLASLEAYAGSIVRTHGLSGLRRPSHLRRQIEADTDLLN